MQAHLGRQPIVRWYYPPEVDYRLSLLPPDAKGLIVWIIEAKVRHVSNCRQILNFRAWNMACAQNLDPCDFHLSYISEIWVGPIWVLDVLRPGSFKACIELGPVWIRALSTPIQVGYLS